MIRMNLEHLLKCYQGEITAVKQDKHNDKLLTPDAYEPTAVKSAMALYKRLQELQQEK